jgi:hypothetical protein
MGTYTPRGVGLIPPRRSRGDKFVCIVCVIVLQVGLQVPVPFAPPPPGWAEASASVTQVDTPRVCNCPGDQRLGHRGNIDRLQVLLCCALPVVLALQVPVPFEPLPMLADASASVTATYPQHHSLFNCDRQARCKLSIVGHCPF